MYVLMYRWVEYDSLGKPVAGTRFISFKVPLKEVGCIQSNMTKLYHIKRDHPVRFGQWWTF